MAKDVISCLYKVQNTRSYLMGDSSPNRLFPSNGFTIFDRYDFRFSVLS